MLKNKKSLGLVIGLVIILISLSCAPGNSRWNQNIEGSKPANFWAGLWHGIIVVITFIISLFRRDVGIYEVNNYGWSYNLGFILGLMISIGGGIRYTRKKKAKKIDWCEIEGKIREGVKAWVNESESEEKKKEWEEIGKKVEEKIKRKIKEWAEKE